MTREALNVCMYTPTSDGGHALYTQELLTALAEVGPDRGVSAELVTAENLASREPDDVLPDPYDPPPARSSPRVLQPDGLGHVEDRVLSPP